MSTDHSGVYFFATRETVTGPAGTYKSLLLIKVDDEMPAYVAASTFELAQAVLDALNQGYDYEVIESAALTADYYVRECPFRLLLITDAQMARTWLADRLNFPYTDHLSSVESLNPLRLAR